MILCKCLPVFQRTDIWLICLEMFPPIVEQTRMEKEEEEKEEEMHFPTSNVEGKGTIHCNSSVFVL